ncbi:MAG: phosphatase PAP2 family protein [Rhodocyclaceae bacterium]|nr:phosphatase PAP2 family protein [Rhodocyclaceae bacterium]
MASSVLDRPAARWADHHQSARWDSVGKAANYIPLALAATSGLIRFGAGGDVAADTARASLLAVGWTLGIDYATRFSLGRARPDQHSGPASFAGPSKGSASSGFPSNHMGMAFAAVTPFAQRYDAPWLYAIAAATAFGRIQQQQHFMSDVVAGSLIGYGMGSMMLDRQRGDRDAKVAFGPNRSVNVSWQY